MHNEIVMLFSDIKCFCKYSLQQVHNKLVVIRCPCDLKILSFLDRTGEVLILDGATFSAKTDLIDGTNILPFQARYIALGQSVAGTANADATFKVQYL